MDEENLNNPEVEEDENIIYLNDENGNEVSFEFLDLIEYDSEQYVVLLPLEDIEDYYTYYVQIMELPEDIFWNAEIPFLDRIIDNKVAYDGWVSSVMEKEREKIRGKKWSKS